MYIYMYIYIYTYIINTNICAYIFIYRNPAATFSPTVTPSLSGVNLYDDDDDDVYLMKLQHGSGFMCIYIVTYSCVYIYI
jgi:hypothetical protein